VLFPLPQLPSAPSRVVITGAGIVTALGRGWAANAAGFRTGQSGFRPVSHFDVKRQRVKIAAEVDCPAQLPETRLSQRQARRLDRATVLLLLAAEEARKQARWSDGTNTPLVLGTTSGGMTSGEEYYRQTVQTPGHHRGQATRALHYQAQTQVRLLAEALGSTGPITIVSNACASGANALGQAWEMLRRGRARRVLAGGYDALSLMVFAGFDALQALSPTVCRPFDAQRDGLLLGEGAAVMTLESLEEAQGREAEILGEMIGYGSVLDLHHLTQPHPEGEAALESMHRACASAGISPAEVDYVNAHGTGTLLNDRAEALAINRWAGERAASLPVSSSKAGIGHLLGAAGAVEAVVCLMTVREQWLPPELTLGKTDDLCRFPVVSQPTQAPVRVALSNSFGFGGANASLVFRRWA
jgi:3-oxoacyl-[acyl-carrier-protein] synthase II